MLHSFVSLKIFFSFLLTLISVVVCAQSIDSIKNKGLLEPTLNDILSLKPDVSSETKVTIANLTETNIYEAPNIITIITDEDIKALGYRDLLDVLNTIPGINIANDVQNGTSIGIRGMWAEEGKVQFMINGMVMNDMAYGSIILGHRFPLANIKRIEVIRGAGSSIYGGLAALGVINIVTKTGQETNGHNFISAIGLSKNKTSRGLLNYNYGGILLKGVELTTTALINSGNRSNETYLMPDSTHANFKDSSLVNNVEILFTLKYKNFAYKQFYEDYNFQATYEPISTLMRTSISNLTYNFKLKKINIIPFFNYKWQMPWNTQYGNPTIYDKQNFITKHTEVGFNGDYKANSWLSFVAGGQYYNDNYKHQRKTFRLNDGNLIQNYNGYITYAEALITTKYLNITVGGRFDKYAYFNPIGLPRISLTKGFKNWHYKLIYGQSFRRPTLQNINLDLTGNLVPERVTECQAQVGFHNKNLELSANVFNNTLHNLIVFGYDTAFNESYSNSSNVTTQGIELESKLKLRKFVLKCNYSNYNIVSSTVNQILVDTLNLKQGTLAMPKHKVVSIITYNFNPKNALCLSYIYQSKKCGFERVNLISNEYRLINYPSTSNINLIYQRNGLFGKLIDINVGIYNILNIKNMYVYPFREGYAPVIGMGRELYLNMKINL